MANAIVVNRGKRIYNLQPDANGKPRVLLPGSSIETIDEKEAKHLLRYSDIDDMNTVSPQTAARIESTQREIERLTAENERLRKQQKGAPAVVAEPAPAALEEEEDVEDKRGSNKKKGR